MRRYDLNADGVSHVVSPPLLSIKLQVNLRQGQKWEGYGLESEHLSSPCRVSQRLVKQHSELTRDQVNPGARIGVLTRIRLSVLGVAAS